jgi:CheY-like chemotaxis protein
MKVLIIDDNNDQRATLGLLLQAIGHQVAVAPDGAAGLALAALFQPDIVFVDFQMPAMDGFAFARALRRRSESKAVRVVLVTGSGSVTPEDARAAGCDALMRKPAALSALLAALHAARCSSVVELSGTASGTLLSSESQSDVQPHALGS